MVYIVPGICNILYHIMVYIVPCIPSYIVTWLIPGTCSLLRRGPAWTLLSSPSPSRSAFFLCSWKTFRGVFLHNYIYPLGSFHTDKNAKKIKQAWFARLEGMIFFWRSLSGRKSVVKFFKCDFSCGFAKKLSQTDKFGLTWLSLCTNHLIGT